MVRSIKASEFVLDLGLYPREQVDDAHVLELRDAIRMGAELPPVVICKKSRKVADGFHRITAYLDEFGGDFPVDAIEKLYDSEEQLFLDAMRYNASHGKRLTDADRGRCILSARRLGINEDDLSSALSVSASRIGQLRPVQMRPDASLTSPYMKANTGRTPVPGVRISPENRHGGSSQFASSSKPKTSDSGAFISSESDMVDRARELAISLCAILGSDMVDAEHELLIQPLRKLAALLDTKLRGEASHA